MYLAVLGRLWTGLKLFGSTQKMGLFSTQKYFPAIFTLLITRKMENLIHSFLAMAGREKYRPAQKMCNVPKVYFLAIFTIFFMEKLHFSTNTSQVKRRSQVGRSQACQKRVLCPKVLFSYFHCIGRKDINLVWCTHTYVLERKSWEDLG